MTYVTETGSPSGSSSPGVLSVSPTTLSLTGTGASNAQNVYVQELGYGGAFSESDTCTAIAAVAPSSGAGPAATFTVTPSSAGTCAATFTDAHANKVSVAITVTTTGFSVQMR